MPDQTVLIADDNHGVRRMVQMVLADAGYTILEAADGMQAVTILRNSPVRLVVLLDLRMPKLSGLELLDLLDRSDETLTRHAYVVMSADFLDAERTALLIRHNITSMGKFLRINELLDNVARAASSLV